MLLPSASVWAQTSATFGQVIPLGGTPSDIVLDESRQQLYLVNSATNQVQIYNYASQQVTGSITVGTTPLSAAMSMDNHYLYVTNHGSASLSVIDLTNPSYSATTVSLPANPQGVEVGADGRAVISTDGSGTSNASNTLLIYDQTQASQNQVLAVAFPPAAATPPSLQQLLAKPTTQFNGKLHRTPDGQYIIGVNSISNNTSTVVFVYETASGTVLRSRTMVGQSSTLSVAPDGASFMAGFTLFNTATLNAIAQQSTANAPFTMSSSFATTYNVGGSVFSPDGTTLYSAFNTAALTTPPPAPQASTMLISNPQNLAINLGINLPESIVAKMVITADGTNAWALSSSGITHLPLSKLYTYPILMPSSTNVFLAQDPCHPGVAQARISVNNIGGGELTFAVPESITGAVGTLIVTTSSGLASATLTLSMDPGLSGAERTVGTNLYTGTGTISTNDGTAVALQLVSPNAINVPPTILVYMNYRDTSMRGLIYPVPVVPNSSSTAYQGLEDILLDEARGLVYITNAGYNRIEVFNTQTMSFQAPIPVGQLPHEMAMGLDGTTLYVANTGGESISIVDLDQQVVTGTIQFPPVPLAGNAAIVAPSGLAVGLSGLQLVMNNGDLWTVIGNQAEPRTGTTITGVSSTGAQTPITSPQTMLGSADGSSILLLGGGGTAYLYNGLADAYTADRQLFTTPIIGYYGPLGLASDGSFLLANGLVLNNSLTVIGGAASPGQVTVTPPAGPGGGGGTSVTSTGLRNVAAVLGAGEDAFLRMTTVVRNSLTATTSDDTHTTLQAVSTTTGATATAAEMPENPVISEFGTTRTAMPPRQMVMDSQGNVYAITLSGLSVVPLTPAGSATQPQLAGSHAIVNAINGSANFQPGSFITINGTNLAAQATATTLPAPTVLGGSCVLFDNVALPLLSTSPTQISAQIPATIRPGENVVEVFSLATAQASSRIVTTIQEPER
ncbi:MAG TPA: hypothetical protein VK419_07935 [Bryobacteraceae bacterium]|nr:hypothetical protein [Bryobacteraceae bacterium]